MKFNVSKRGYKGEGKEVRLSNMAVRTVYSRENSVSYGAEQYRIPYCQHTAKTLDGTGTMAVIWHCTTVSPRAWCAALNNDTGSHASYFLTRVDEKRMRGATRE